MRPVSLNTWRAYFFVCFFVTCPPIWASSLVSIDISSNTKSADAPGICPSVLSASSIETSATGSSRIQLSVLHYEGDVAPIPEAFTSAAVKNKVSVWQGQFKEVAPNVSVFSYGFSICNVVMIRNNKSGRLTFYHYWGAEDSSFDNLDQSIRSFDPDSIEVVVFGNLSSTSLSVIESHLRKRVKYVKRYRIEESGRWEFIYKQNSDQILYHGTDSKNVAIIDDVFGSGAVEMAEKRFPEHDYRLRIQIAKTEIDRIFSKISYVINEISLPRDFADLPSSEMDLRLLAISRYQEYLAMAQLNSKERADAEQSLLRQKKILKNKFGVNI